MGLDLPLSVEAPVVVEVSPADGALVFAENITTLAATVSDGAGPGRQLRAGDRRLAHGHPRCSTS